MASNGGHARKTKKKALRNQANFLAKQEVKVGDIYKRLMRLTEKGGRDGLG